MIVIGLIINYVLLFYMALLFARMLLSWVPMFAPSWRPKGPWLVIAEFIYTLTDPPLRLLRKVLPTVNLGSGVALDLGFIVLWVVVVLLRQLNFMIFLTAPYSFR